MSGLLAFVLAAGVTVAQAPGAILDPSDFKYQRPIAPGPAAVVVLPLDAAVLAHSRGPVWRFADVRIADSSDRQVQYLLEEVAGGETMTSVTFAKTEVPTELQGRGNRSTYRVELPYAGLKGASLLVSSTAETFTREMRVSVERVPDRRHRDRWLEEVGSYRWNGANDLPLAVPLPDTLDTAAVLLTVEEGDNAPLPIAAVRLLLPTWRLRFYRPNDEPLRLLYGSARAAEPEYDIRLRRAELAKTRAEEIGAGPEVITKKTAAIVSPRVFWGVLIATVLVLLALVARLATSSRSEDPSPPSAPGP